MGFSRMLFLAAAVVMLCSATQGYAQDPPPPNPAMDVAIDASQTFAYEGDIVIFTIALVLHYSSNDG